MLMQLSFLGLGFCGWFVGVFSSCICWSNITSSGSNVTGKTTKLESKTSHRIQRETFHTRGQGGGVELQSVDNQ